MMAKKLLILKSLGVCIKSEIEKLYFVIGNGLKKISKIIFTQKDLGEIFH